MIISKLSIEFYQLRSVTTPITSCFFFFTCVCLPGFSMIYGRFSSTLHDDPLFSNMLSRKSFIRLVPGERTVIQLIEHVVLLHHCLSIGGQQALYC